VVDGAFDRVRAPPASIPSLCRYVNSARGCSLGDRCPFYHTNYEAEERARRLRFEKQQKQAAAKGKASGPRTARCAN